VAWQKERSHERPSVEQGRRKNQTRNNFQEEPENYERSERDNGYARKALMEPGTEISRRSYVLEERGNRLDLQENHGTGVLEASIRNFKRNTKKEELVLVEGSAPSQTKEETACRAGVGIVEAPAPNDRKRERSSQQGAARDERPQEGSGCSGWRTGNGREGNTEPGKRTLQAQPSEEKER
jgi:hypothetical protein